MVTTLHLGSMLIYYHELHVLYLIRLKESSQLDHNKIQKVKKGSVENMKTIKNIVLFKIQGIV